MTTSRSFISAAKAGDLEEVKNLFNKNLLEEDDGDGLTALHWAAWRGHTLVVEFLLQNKANQNAVSSYKRTPLTCAASYGHVDVVKILLANGANVDAVTQAGKTALIEAIDYNDKEVAQRYHDCVEAILEYKPNLGAQDSSGKTALMSAAHSSLREKTFDILLEKKADLERKDHEDRTVFLKVVSQNDPYSIRCLRKLIEHGAQVNVKNRQGQSAIDANYDIRCC